MPDLITILSSVGFSGLLSAAIIFLAKSWISERLKNAIKHEYDEKLETHKAKLKCESDREIEHLKTQLQIAAAERNIRLSRVFERTAETIAATYAKLLAFYQTAQDYMQPGPSGGADRKQLGRNLQNKANEFVQYFLPNKLYIRRGTAEKIWDFSNTLQRMIRMFDMSAALEAGLPANREVTERMDTNLENLHERVPALLAQLEDDFQEELGFQKEKSKPLEGQASQ